jgi:regulator of replication initiation timing
MQREQVTRKSQAAMVVGWISNTDAIFVGLILTLTVTLVIACRLQKSEGTTRQMQANLDELHGQVGQSHDQLGRIRKHIADLETQRDRLVQDKCQLDRIAAQVTPLQTERDRLADSLATSADEKKRLTTENEKLTAKLAACREYYLTMKKNLAQTTIEKQESAIRLVAATEERDAAHREARALRGRIEAEPGLHKELIGLKGNLGRVAIIFDTSGSMALSGRWDQARGVVATWLEHLAISECVLVLFSNDAQIYPEDGSFLDMRGPSGAANRKLLLSRIEATKPDGGTNTLLALQVAYRCPNLDTIILFTDGEPNNPKGVVANQFDPEVAKKIYALLQQYKEIPVNTVGLGNYFKPQLSGFLMRVAQDTGGSFLGR